MDRSTTASRQEQIDFDNAMPAGKSYASMAAAGSAEMIMEASWCTAMFVDQAIDLAVDLAVDGLVDLTVDLVLARDI